MRIVQWAILLFFVAAALGPTQFAAAQTDSCAFEVVTFQNSGLTIRGGVFYNNDGKKRPVLVFSRGSGLSKEEEQRPAWEGHIRQPVACQLVMTYGWVVFVAERRGYGGSAGQGWTDFNQSVRAPRGTTERGMSFATRLQQESQDVRAGITLIQSKPYARPEYVVWGHSAGGIISMFLGAEPLPGLMAVVNSVGGIAWDINCSTCYYRDVHSAASQAGMKTSVPTLLQTGADDWFRTSVRQLYQELKSAGKNVTLNEHNGLKHWEFRPMDWRANMQDIAHFLQPLQVALAPSGN